MILRLELLHNPANMVCLNWFQATFGGTLYPIAGRNPIDQVVYPGYMSAWDVRSAAALALASQLMDFSIAKKQNYEVIGANYPLCRWALTTPTRTPARPSRVTTRRMPARSPRACSSTRSSRVQREGPPARDADDR